MLHAACCLIILYMMPMMHTHSHAEALATSAKCSLAKQSQVYQHESQVNPYSDTSMR